MMTEIYGQKNARGEYTGLYAPEGTRYLQEENRCRTASEAGLLEAQHSGRILEGIVTLCGSSHDLTVDLGGRIRGKIPREEGALGIDTGETRDIALISRVNRPVCFTVTGFTEENGERIALLSRRRAQEMCREDYIAKLRSGMIIRARVTHPDSFGCFVDIGCGIPSLIPIDAVSVSRIAHPKERFRTGQDILAAVRSSDEQGRICLTHKELLGTWEENAALYQAGETVTGVIRSVESYGIFVELTPNLAGLAEPCEGARAGQTVSVYIKSLIPERMKIKLIIVDLFDEPLPPKPFRYYLPEDGNMLTEWVYSPACCRRRIATDFTE